MSMTSDGDESMMFKNDEDSPFSDDANSGRSVRGKGPLKRGPWTNAEDDILIEYVTKNGEGNWNAVQKNSGLARCGKSCRLRWANHLRPDLKKGAFTIEEECRIVELHAKMGNKWARMAAELPGRTDNEIKNYWNTRTKKLQRAGLPIYPADLSFQESNENEQINDMNVFSFEDMHHHPNFIPPIEIPNFKIQNFELNHHLSPPLSTSNLLDIPNKRFRGPESFFPDLNPAFINTIPNEKNSQPLMFSFEFDDNSISNVISGSHSGLNGNSSSSAPSRAMMTELPSLQTHKGSWGISTSSSPLPSLDSVDSFIRKPPTENIELCNLSSTNSGLLEAVCFKSTMRKPNKYSEKISSQDLHETEWEAFEKPFFPFDHSSSIFSEATPTSGNSLCEPQSVKITPDCKIEKARNLVPMQNDDKDEMQNGMICYTPDMFLDESNCFDQYPTGDHYVFTNVEGNFLIRD